MEVKKAYDIKKEIGTLEREAKALLNYLFARAPIRKEARVERIVDCIVSAAILKTALIQAEAFTKP